MYLDCTLYLCFGLVSALLRCIHCLIISFQTRSRWSLLASGFLRPAFCILKWECSAAICWSWGGFSIRQSLTYVHVARDNIHVASPQWGLNLYGASVWGFWCRCRGLPLVGPTCPCSWSSSSCHSCLVFRACKRIRFISSYSDQVLKLFWVKIHVQRLIPSLGTFS